jgi:ubiquinone/menaquinone biosynthesis C-methylase UbiE
LLGVNHVTIAGEVLGGATIITIIMIIVSLVIFLKVFSFLRIDLPRKPSIEGIEDIEAVQAYDRISRWPQFRLIRRIFVSRLGDHRPKGILADIGCGPGHLAVLIAQKYRHLHIVGFDTAEEMVHNASINASSLAISDRVEFRKGDVSSLPVPDSTLDFVVSTFSLHHWSDPDLVLGEIHRILKPEGQILLFDLRRDARRFFFWLLRFAQKVVVPIGIRRFNEPVGSLLSSYSLSEIQALFDRSPFTAWRIKGAAGWMFAWATKH